MIESASSHYPNNAPFFETFFCKVEAVRITEIFFSIQGESSHVGKPCIFVRLTGCSLRCVWCDTKYAYSGGREMTHDEVLSEVEKHPAKLVEVTGGEPLEHEEVYP